MPSKTMRVAPISSALAFEDASMPTRSNSPALTTSGDSRASRKNSFFFASVGRSQPKVAGVGDDLAGALLEGDEDAGLLGVARAVDQRLQREDGLAAAGAAHHQRGAPARQAAVGDLVEALDAGQGFGQPNRSRILR